MKGEVMSARRRMLFNGIVVASLAVDQAGQSARPAEDQRARPAGPGGSRSGPGRRRFLPTYCAICRANLQAATMRGLQEAARAALRRALGRKLGKRPMVDVHLIRV